MRKLGILSVGVVGAVLAAIVFPLTAMLLPLCGVSIGIGLIGVLLRKRSAKMSCVLRYVSVGFVIGFFSMVCHQEMQFQPAQGLDNTTIELQAVVTGIPEPSYDMWQVPVTCITEQGRRLPMLLTIDERGETLQPGDEISGIAHCQLAGTYQRAQGILLTGKFYGDLTVQSPGHIPFWMLPLVWAEELKDTIVQVFPETVSPITVAVVTGDTDLLSEELNLALQHTGLSHAVAVSGMHLAFLAGMVSLCLGGNRRLTAILLIPICIIFTIMTGCTPSVVRATIMILLTQLAPLVNRESDSLTTMAVALGLQVLQNPYTLLHIGLQLSFAAVAGILLCSDVVYNGLQGCFHLKKAKRWSILWWRQLIPKLVIATLASTAGASVFTLPLIAFHMQSVSLIAPLSNLIVLWAMDFLFQIGLVLGLMGLVFAPLAQLIAVPTVFLAHYIQGAVTWLDGLPFSSLSLEGEYYCIWFLYSYLILAGVWLIPGRKRAIAPIGGIVFMLSLSILLTAWSFWWGEASVTVLDVGQGQCVLVRMGNFLCMVDCGGNRDAGEKAVSYLKNAGVTRLDLLVLTHYHADHANGIEQVLKQIQVDHIALADVEEDSSLRSEIEGLCALTGVDQCMIDTKTQFQLEDGSITLFPPMFQSGDVNEQGLSCLVSWGETDLLLTGDMSEEGEQELLQQLPVSQVELLMAGHHGSATSTSQQLLSQLRPGLVLISVGENNRYGHPAPETLQRIQDIGAGVLRTDQSGKIQIQIQEVETFGSQSEDGSNGLSPVGEGTV